MGRFLKIKKEKKEYTTPGFKLSKSSIRFGVISIILCGATLLGVVGGLNPSLFGILNNENKNVKTFTNQKIVLNYDNGSFIRDVDLTDRFISDVYFKFDIVFPNDETQTVNPAEVVIDQKDGYYGSQSYTTLIDNIERQISFTMDITIDTKKPVLDYVLKITDLPDDYNISNVEFETKLNSLKIKPNIEINLSSNLTDNPDTRIPLTKTGDYFIISDKEDSTIKIEGYYLDSPTVGNSITLDLRYQYQKIDNQSKYKLRYDSSFDTSYDSFKNNPYIVILNSTKDIEYKIIFDNSTASDTDQSFWKNGVKIKSIYYTKLTTTASDIDYLYIEEVVR